MRNNQKLLIPILGLFLLSLLIFQTLEHSSIQVYAHDFKGTISKSSQTSVTTVLKKDTAATYPTAVIIQNGILDPKVYITKQKTVKSTLDSLKINYNTNDIIYPSLDSEVFDGMHIKIIKVSKLCNEHIEQIPFTTIYEEDPNAPIGSNTIEQEGVNGQRLKESCTVSYNGVLDKTKAVKNERILVQMTPQIIKKGTKVIETNSSCKYWDDVIDSKTADPRIRKWLKGLVRCESTCNPLAQNGNYFYGLLQFAPRTFRVYGGTDIWNGQDQIDIAIKMYNHYNGNRVYIIKQWPCSKNFL
jgi:uncharacterized protein YabE (DUF348 family)